jgi:hypothetical protein
MTRANGDIVFPIPNLPYNSPVVNFYNKGSPDMSNGDARKLKNGLSFPYEGFFNAVKEKVSSFNGRAFDSILRNPDFNILSANGTAPVTPAQGSNYELVSNWFLMNSDAANNYVITPTAYTTIPPFGSGSNYYLNVSIPSLNTPFYFYNKNYSTTGQFISSSQTSGQTVTCSAVIKNNTAEQQKVRFSALLNGTSQLIKGGGVFLQPDTYNLISTSIDIPDIKNSVSDPSAYTQFQFSFENDYGTPMDMDIYYLKTEISDLSTPLQVNHILEQLICSNLS